jgi:hypothetical protein
MKKKFSGKATRQSVSIPSDMMEEVQRQLQRRDRNFSAYMQELISEDLSSNASTPDPQDNQALVHLAEEFHPTAVDEIRKWTENMDGLQQPFFIYRMLCALHDAISKNQPRLALELPQKS